jgi:hypothetical protein
MRCRFLLAFLLLAWPCAAFGDETTPRPGYVARGGGGPTDTTLPSATPRQPPCPGFSMGPIEGYVGGGADLTGPLFAISHYTCSDKPGQRFPTFNCILNCGPETPYIPPPNPQEVADRIFDYAPDPVPAFAPPLEQGAFAVVGKRIYFSTAPGTYQSQTPQVAFAGDWYARGQIDPIELQFTIPGHPTQVCEGPGKDATTPAGRDNNPCFILVDQAPPDYRGQITLAIKWKVTVIDTNISNVPQITYGLTTSSAVVDIKELQAVVVG